jgi:hypothetical protein
LIKGPIWAPGSKPGATSSRFTESMNAGMNRSAMERCT